MTPEDVYGDDAPLYERWCALQRQWALVEERYQIARQGICKSPGDGGCSLYEASNPEVRVRLRLEAMDLAVQARLAKDALDLAIYGKLRGGNDKNT